MANISADSVISNNGNVGIVALQTIQRNYYYNVFLKFLHFLGASPKFPVLRVISVVMLYSNSASNPILYNICNEQFRDGFKQYFKPCSRTLCPGMNCKEDEYSNETKESDYISLVYSPKSRLSTASQISSGRNSIIQNGNCMSVSSDKERRLRDKDSSSSFVWHRSWIIIAKNTKINLVVLTTCSPVK